MDASGALLLALRDGNIQARIANLNLDDSLLDNWTPVEPSFWDADANGVAVRTPWGIREKAEAYVEFDIPSVQKWLEGRNRPYRPKGSGLADTDAPFVAEMKRLLAKKQAWSPTEAARQVIKRHGRRVPGGGTDDSKVSRLVKRFKALHGK